MGKSARGSQVAPSRSSVLTLFLCTLPLSLDLVGVSGKFLVLFLVGMGEGEEEPKGCRRGWAQLD